MSLSFTVHQTLILANIGSVRLNDNDTEIASLVRLTERALGRFEREYDFYTNVGKGNWREVRKYHKLLISCIDDVVVRAMTVKSQHGDSVEAATADWLIKGRRFRNSVDTLSRPT